MITFFCILIGVILLAIMLIIFSTIKFNIKELEIINAKIIKFNLQISLNLFNKIQWLKVTINKKRMRNLKDSKKIEMINKILRTRVLKKYRNIKKVVRKEWKQILKQITKVEIEKLNLDTIIGTESADTTAYATSAVAIVVPIIFGRKTEKLSYKVRPVYLDKNYIYVSLNCIISLKLVHIINIKR